MGGRTWFTGEANVDGGLPAFPGLKRRAVFPQLGRCRPGSEPRPWSRSQHSPLVDSVGAAWSWDARAPSGGTRTGAQGALFLRLQEKAARSRRPHQGDRGQDTSGAPPPPAFLTQPSSPAEPHPPRRGICTWSACEQVCTHLSVHMCKHECVSGVMCGCACIEYVHVCVSTPASTCLSVHARV